MAENKETELFYEKLSRLRKSTNIELREISEKTKINIKYLEAIEKGDFNSLPNTYVRLFIKAYAEHLKADVDIILQEYDKYVNVKPKKFIYLKNADKTNHNKKEGLDKTGEKNLSINKNFNEKLNLKSNSKKNITRIGFNITNKYFFTPSKIFKMLSIFSILIFVYLLISYLSKQQKEIILSNMNLQNETNLNQDININDKTLINKNNFKPENFIKQKKHKLKNEIKIPYIFKITTQQKTKIYIGHDDGWGNIIEDCNIIAKKDSLLKFENSNTIYFDLWNAQHVQIQINDNAISKYLGNEEVLVRGSFNPNKKELYLRFYSY